MYTATAVDEELDAMAGTPGCPPEREVLQEELKIMTMLLEKLTDLRRANNDMNESADDAHHPPSSIPLAPSA